MWGPDHEPHSVRNGLVAPSLNEMLILVRVFGAVYVLVCKVRGQFVLQQMRGQWIAGHWKKFSGQQFKMGKGVFQPVFFGG